MSSVNRASEVDESQSAIEPPRFLNVFFPELVIARFNTEKEINYRSLYLQGGPNILAISVPITALYCTSEFRFVHCLSPLAERLDV
jgi:hypothetical protein